MTSSYTDLWEFYPWEITDCNFQEGKTGEDYAEVMKLFNAHLDNLGVTAYEAITMEPYYYGSEHRHFLRWVSYWLSGEDLGNYSVKWTGSWGTPEGAKVLVPYGETVVYDNHMGWSVALVRKPKTQKVTDNSIIVMQDCRFTEKPTSMEEVRKAVNALVSEMDNRKYENGVWIMFPSWGYTNSDYDFKLLTRYDSFAELGVAWEMYAPGTEASEAIRKITSDVFSSYVQEVNFVTVRRYKSG